LPVLIAFPDRLKQRRWTVLIRAILAIPLAVCIFFVAIGAVFVGIIGWFGALFTGRLPLFAREYLTRYMMMTVDLTGYLYFLTDTFPPFDPADPQFPAQLAMPAATKLNRWAVFFRIILGIPASLVSIALSYGLSILSFFLWVITLVTGWLPLSAHNALAASIRYQARLTAYAYLLVPTYPNGVFGDGIEPAAPETAAPEPNALEFLLRSTETGPGEAPDAPEVAPPMAAEPVASVSPAVSPSRQDRWRLVLNRGARRLLVIAIILGAAGYVGQLTLQITLRSHVGNQALNPAVSSLDASFQQYALNVKDCATGANQVACIEQQASVVESQLRTFAVRINGSDGSGLPSGAVASVISSARTCAALFEKLANAGPTATDYLVKAQSLPIQSDLNQLQTDLNAL
jgi:uncharacterized protein DUF4389